MKPEQAHFALDWASLTPPADRGSISSHPTKVATAEGEVRIGCDHDGLRHILLPVASTDSVSVDRRSQGVMLVGQELQVDGEIRPFADLVCLDRMLNEVFNELCLDVCRRILEHEGEPLGILVKTLGDWRHLLAYSHDPVAITKVLGLFGELEILHQCAQVEPTTVLDAWLGPFGGAHDFQRDHVLMEVKTTMAHLGSTITVHGPDQLDPPEGHELHICLVGVTVDESGRSVVDIVTEIRELGVPSDKLAEALEQVGYSPEPGTAWHTRFRVERVSLWRITKGFPGIRRSELGANQLLGVEELSYRLNLEAAGPALSATDRAQVLDRLSSGIGQ